MRSRYKITEKDGIYFITSTIVEWIPVFTGKPYFDLMIQSFAFCRENKGLQLSGYVILDNHFHAIVGGLNLGRIIADLKKFTANTILEQLQRDGKTWLLNQLAYYKKRHKTESDYQVWQEGYHPELIMSEAILIQKLEYIHSNPVKRYLFTSYLSHPCLRMNSQADSSSRLKADSRGHFRTKTVRFSVMLLRI